jgi:hypothetical protein
MLCREFSRVCSAYYKIPTISFCGRKAEFLVFSLVVHAVTIRPFCERLKAYFCCSDTPVYFKAVIKQLNTDLTCLSAVILSIIVTPF